MLVFGTRFRAVQPIVQHHPLNPVYAGSGVFLCNQGSVMAVLTVVPLHRMIRDALKELKDARADGPPDHRSETCSGACLICTYQRKLDRLLDRLPPAKNQENHG